MHHTLIRQTHYAYKSYLNYFAPPALHALDHVRASCRNIGRFLRADFHDDSGLKNLIECFYLAVRGEVPLPIRYREIVLTSRTMDSIFAQLAEQRTESSIECDVHEARGQFS